MSTRSATPLDYTLIKRVARESGNSINNLLALAPQNDPFYVGTKGQRLKGEWFAKIYEAMGSPPRCHIRRVHYWLVTTNAVPKPNGKPYENTENDWYLMTMAAKYARYLGLVPIDSLIDRRNPDPIIHAHHWQHTAPSSVRDSIDEDNIIDSIVDQFYCFNPCQTQAYMIECWCFTPDTKVQTISGPRPVSEIQIGDLVLTHKGRYKPVINTMKRHYDGDLTCVRSRYSCNTVKMTPDHHTLIAKGGPAKVLNSNLANPQWLPASDLSNSRRGAHYVGDYVAFPRLQDVNCEVPVIEPDDTAGAAGRKDGRGGARAAKINRVTIDSEVAWMLGYLVGNGFVGARSLTFTLNAADALYADRLIEIGTRFGIKPTKSIYGNTVKVKYNTIRLCKWFKEQFGGESLGRSHTGSWNKRIPTWAIQGPEDISRSFLRGLWDADGTEHSVNHKSIVTCSANVASGLRMLLARFGEFPSISRTKDNHTLLTWGGTYTYGKLTEEYLWCPLRSVTSEPYTGYVYNIEVAEDNSYVTEFVVHNCEKSTMNDVTEPICRQYGMNLVTGLGELSITAVYLLARRIIECRKPVRILYISDFDPAGECMPVSVARKIEYFVRTHNLSADVKLIPLMLTATQCQHYSLPRTPIKETEKRKEGFESRHGVGATELDAMEALHPGEMRRLIEQAIEPYFDVESWNAAVRKNREVKEHVRKYLVGGECEYCEGQGFVSEGDISTGTYESADCENCNGTGQLEGKVGTDIMSALDTSDYDSYTPPQADTTDDSETPAHLSESGSRSRSWLYDSGLGYVEQIERYREHKQQTQAGADTDDDSNDTEDDDNA